MSANRTCTATFNQAPPPTYTVTVNSTGTGTGSISSSPAGISYSYPPTNTGSANFNQGSTVVITATANLGSTVSWNGTCTAAGGAEQVVSPTEIRCTFNNLNSDKTITATFTAAPVTYTLTVNRQGNGSGTV
ncbi:MAG: hypothetical protein NZL86_07705, partial [Aquificaceae bacterium]|nr:hypothetical protein [Aquificaceae bacterium]